MNATTKTTLSDELIGRCGSRAAAYDRDNRFFTEDFEELRAAGYLKMAVPEHLGGPGMTLAEICREQRRLAYRAPATALATNMHLYWTGLAADMRRAGDKSLEWILAEAAAGEVFAAGHGEAGNDLPLFLSTAKAERVDGGYRFWGHKTFGSLTPVWTRLGLHAMDASNPSAPQIIHAFLPRDAKGYSIKETWDTLGMRATRSDDTILDGAFVPDRYIARRLPAGTADLFVLSIFGWAEPTFANIYLGLAERARDLAAAGVKKRTSLALTRSMAYHPEVQRCFSEMQLALEASDRPGRPHRRRLVESGRSRHGVADEARGGQAQRGRGRQEGRRSRDVRLGRHGHVQVERARAALSRRPLRRVSSGQLDPGPRDRRQDGARDRSRRAAAVGMIRTHMV